MIATEKTVEFYTPDGRLYGLSGELPDGSYGMITAKTEEIQRHWLFFKKKRKITQEELNKALGIENDSY